MFEAGEMLETLCYANANTRDTNRISEYKTGTLSTLGEMLDSDVDYFHGTKKDTENAEDMTHENSLNSRNGNKSPLVISNNNILKRLLLAAINNTDDLRIKKKKVIEVESPVFHDSLEINEDTCYIKTLGLNVDTKTAINYVKVEHNYTASENSQENNDQTVSVSELQGEKLTVSVSDDHAGIEDVSVKDQ